MLLADYPALSYLTLDKKLNYISIKRKAAQNLIINNIFSWNCWKKKKYFLCVNPTESKKHKVILR